MDLHRMITELKSERDAIEDAILALERVLAHRSGRRGRPPAWIRQMRQQSNTGRWGEGSPNRPKGAT